MTKRYSMVIVGGGSTWTPGLLKALCKRQATFPLRRLVMYDVDAGRQAVIGEFARLLFSEEYPEVDFSYTTDVEEAFREVDFVFCQMRTGGYAMREKDEKIPLSLGLSGRRPAVPAVSPMACAPSAT